MHCIVQLFHNYYTKGFNFLTIEMTTFQLQYVHFFCMNLVNDDLSAQLVDVYSLVWLSKCEWSVGMDD